MDRAAWKVHGDDEAARDVAEGREAGGGQADQYSEAGIGGSFGGAARGFGVGGGAAERADGFYVAGTAASAGKVASADAGDGGHCAGVSEDWFCGRGRA